ncbi:hypothetical protein LI328DRAFT_137693 [Trichoderma asperelloides]|nr:hypothetical protein LI328DRAFT_137693 [Trichoderma asperelloides]
MGNSMREAIQQNVIYRQYFLLILLTLLHGYYNFIRLDGWLRGTIGFLKETVTVIVVGQFYFGNYYASCDKKRHIAERNVRQATHAANTTGIVFIALGLVWGCYILTTNNDDNENAFNIMNNRLYLIVLMTMAFFIQLCYLKPGINELEFFVYILKYPWRFIWPAQWNEIFRGSENKH